MTIIGQYTFHVDKSGAQKKQDLYIPKICQKFYRKPIMREM